VSEGGWPSQLQAGSLWSEEDPLFTAPDGHPFDADEGLRYDEGALLGRGGMGRVVTVWDRRLEREVAMKVSVTRGPGDDPVLLARLTHEAWITSRLDHPGIVPVFDAGRRADGQLFYTMRLVRGRTLTQAIAAGGDPAPLLRSFLAVCEAVAYAHSMQVVHRDLKPDNIMLGGFGETQVMDWGLAVRLDEMAERRGGAVGTPGFMAPEQGRGAMAAPPADVFSLGQILALFATDADRPEIAAIVTRATDADPDRRYPSARELAEDVRRYLDGRRVAAHEYTAWELLGRLVQQWKAPLVAALAVLVAAGVALGFAFAETAAERDRARAAERQSRETLAQSLELHALQALEQSQFGEAEVLATEAGLARDSPLARGVRSLTAAFDGVRQLRHWKLPNGCDAVPAPSGSAAICLFQDRLEAWAWTEAGGERRWSLPKTARLAGFIGANEQWVLAVVTDKGSTGLLLDAATGRVQASGLMGLRDRGFFRASGALTPISRGADWASAEAGAILHHKVYGAHVLHQTGGLSGDGRRLVLMALPNRLFLGAPADLASLAPIKVDLTPFAKATVVVPSNDGRWIWSGSVEGRLRRWDLQTNQFVEAHDTPFGMIRHLEPSPDDTFAAVAGDRGGVALWDLVRRQMSVRLPASAGGRPVWSPQGKLHVGARGGVWTYAVGIEHAPIETAESGFTSLRFLGSALLATTNGVSGRTVGGRGTWHLPSRGVIIKDGDTTSDGRYLATGQRAPNELWLVDPQRQEVRAVAEYSASRRVVVLNHGWFLMTTWVSAYLVGKLQGDSAVIERHDVEFVYKDLERSPDRQFAVMLAERSGEFAVFEARPGGPTLVQTGKLPGAIAAAISNGGGLMAFTTGDRVVLAQRDGTVIAELREGAAMAPLMEIELSPDGQWVAVGDRSGYLRVWNTRTHALAVSLPAHQERIAALTFNDDGSLLASGGWDDRIRVWRTQAWAETPAAAARAASRWGLTWQQALRWADR